MAAVDPQSGLPVQAPPGVALQVVAPPEEIRKQEVQGPQTTTVKPTAEAIAQLAAQKTGNEAALTAADKEQAIKQEIAGQEAEDAAGRPDIAQHFEDLRAAERAEHQKQLGIKMAEVNRRRGEMEAIANEKPNFYWQDKSAPGRILSGFLAGLGGLTRGNGPNQVMEHWANEETKDRQAKIDKFARSKEFLALAQNDTEAAKEALRDKLAEINEEELVNRRILDARQAALIKRLGVPQAQAAYEAQRATKQSTEAEKIAKAQEHYSTKIEGARTTQSLTENVNKGANKAAGNVIRDNAGQPIALPNGEPATARNEKSADEIDKQRAGTMALVNNVKRLVDYASQPVTRRFVNALSGGPEAIRQQVKMEWLRSTVGRVTAEEMKAADSVIPSATSIIKNPELMGQGFMFRSLNQTANTLAASSNMPLEQARKTVADWVSNSDPGVAKAWLETHHQAAPVNPAAVPLPAPRAASKSAPVQTRTLSNGARAVNVNGKWRVLD